MSQKELNKKYYMNFLLDVYELRERGYISEENFETIIRTVISYMISHKVTHDFNSYFYKKFESRLHNSFRELVPS